MIDFENIRKAIKEVILATNYSFTAGQPLFNGTQKLNSSSLQQSSKTRQVQSKDVTHVTATTTKTKRCRPFSLKIHQPLTTSGKTSGYNTGSPSTDRAPVGLTKETISNEIQFRNSNSNDYFI